MENKASTLFQALPKFSPLLPYFEGIEISDLKTLTPEDLKKNVEPKHRILLHLLIDQVLKTYLLQPVHPQSPLRVPIYLPNDPFTLEKFSPEPDGTLNLRSQLSSTLLSKGVNSRAINCKEFFQRIDGDALEKTRRLICSHNDLFDCDVKYLSKAVAAMPNCSEVDLSFNRLYGTSEETKMLLDTNIKSMLELSHVNYVVVIGNVIASLSRKDFYQDLKEEHLKKLIWIPKEWLAGNGWKSVLENVNFHPMVEKLHQKYWNEVYKPV